MPKTNQHILHIQIKDQRGTFQRKLFGKDQLTLGRSPENDIVVFDAAYPKRQTLLQCNKGSCSLYIHPKMRGGIKYKDSSLSFQDLMIQDILPKQGDFYVLTFSPGRQGIVHIDDTQVAFKLDGASPVDSSLPSYTWKTAVRKTLTSDMVFKVLLVLFIGLEVFWAMHVRNIELPPQEPPEVEQVPDRFARFMLQAPAVEPEITSAAGSGGMEGASDQQEETQESGESSGSGGSGDADKPVTSTGLLGLIGGTGEGSASSSVDYLLDQGLVKELDDLVGRSTNLQNRNAGGSGNGSGSGDDLDALLAQGLGGVDDLISNDSGVERVELEKKGSVNIQAPQTVSGSQEARGQRSAESVMSIINSQRGRVMYTYNKHLRQDPALRGKVSLDVTIDAGGRVSNVQTVESTIQNQNFIRDLINILRGLRFSAISEGTVTVNVPFVFNRVN